MHLHSASHSPALRLNDDQMGSDWSSVVGPPVVISSTTSQRQTEPNARGLANAFVPTASYDGTSVGCFAHLASNLRSFSIGIRPIPVPPYGNFSLSMPLLCPTGQTKVLVHRERWTTMPQIAHERHVRPMRWRGEATRYYNYPLAPIPATTNSRCTGCTMQLLRS